jgi:succinate dehydrogenase flavin-adding protein (antitoxin of CptAB toxin-antitoxin module)
MMPENMEIDTPGRMINFGEKQITLLDRFVLDFIQVLEQQTPYVIVSGYVAILLGRSRGTEDVDILVPRLEKARFAALHDALLSEGYEFLNAEDTGGLYEMLTGKMGIRVAKKGQFIPNIELKFFKDDIDQSVFQNRVDVVLPDAHVYISPIEVQIAYKVWLGSPKDIEDALFLFEIFRQHLDQELLKKQMKAFHVSGDEYGIIL